MTEPSNVVDLQEPRVRMSGQERRAQLLRIGRALFAERGYEAASVEEIAERAKVSKPVVYEHFGGKEGLYAVIVDHEVTHLLQRITAALEAQHPRVALEQVADAFLSYVEDEEEGFRILVRDAPLGTATGSLPTVMGDIGAAVESLLAKEFKARGYDRKIAPVLARALVGMVALTGLWWLDAGKPSRQVVAAHLVNLAWNGLKDLEPDPIRSKRAR
ncbi:MAG: TetR/AcrR family transcriptional regulator [Actinomycetota bacterium]|nr:TetR/AcrR family transcriptional regulator [Actinomycetota bacterium]